MALPGDEFKNVRKKCGGDCADHVAAAHEVLRGVRALLGDGAVEAAELRVRECAAAATANAAAAGSSSSSLPVFEFLRERARLLGAVEACSKFGLYTSTA